jgi:hypothetical protein
MSGDSGYLSVGDLDLGLYFLVAYFFILTLPL